MARKKKKIPYLNKRSNGSLRYVRDYPESLRKAIPSMPTQFSVRRQNLEGQILKNVMLEGVKKDIVCLPVHDAVAVQQEHLEWAKDTMLECWDRQMETIGLASVKIDLP